ncbi:MAG: cadmium-translocating P-type ATPase [Lentisphaeria bacterium]|nr:cadmium-translocating P-type ATPase [Lentisphaeria bacterium]
MTLEADPSLLPPDKIAEAVKKAGYEATLLAGTASAPQPEEDTGRKETVRFGIAAAAAILLSYVAMHEMLHLPFIPMKPGWNALLQIILLLPVVAAGYRFYTGGFRALFRGSPNMDSLIASGTGAAIAYSFWLCARGEFGHLYFDTAGMIVALIMLGKYLEGRSKRKASGAIRELMRLAPDTAIRIENGEEREIPAALVKAGDLLRVKPGERIPVDGVDAEGTTSVDESMLTGESMPVDKSPGDPLTGGSINRNGSIVMRATRIGEETTLARIIKLVEDAQGSRPPIARLADKVSGYFVWGVLAIAAVTLAGWLLAGAAFAAALEFALAVLVIACPCALGLATPIAIIVGIGRGAKSGILIKSGAVLENAGKISAIVFDKTGTLTIGEPKVNEVKCVPGVTETELLAAAAAAEKHSTHPLAEAVVREAEAKKLALPAATEFESRPGYGVSATIGGKHWIFGNTRMLDEEKIGHKAFESLGVSAGQSLIYAACGGKPAGAIGIGDTLKPGAAAAIERLNALGIETVMLTGDNLAAAKAMAGELHLASFRAELLPGGKAEIIRELQAGGTRIIAMVGDGINDAPALAQADVGIAIGSGTDVAMESADVVLMQSDLAEVPAAVELSRATMRIIRQNLFWAFFYNVVGIPLAAGAFYNLLGWKLSPVVGAMAMAASSVTVVLNALRLRGLKLAGGRR